MKRREFITLLGGAAVAWPLAARTQQAGRVWRVGVLETVSPALNAASFNALRGGLRDLGYVEGTNLDIQYLSADGRTDRFPALAMELLRLKADVIVTRGTSAVQAAKNATATTPIVMAASGDPLGAGLIAGLAHPGANVTGLSAFTVELIGKRIEILREMIAGISRVAYLHNSQNPVARTQFEEFKASGRSLGVDPIFLDARSPEDIERAFENAAAQRIDAFIVANDTVTHANRRLVVELAAKHSLPVMYQAREFVDAGGLIAYGVSYPDLYRRAATFIDKILKGAKPADLPVEQPTKFELVINLKTAKALGLPVPPIMLARADEVIE